MSQKKYVFIILILVVLTSACSSDNVRNYSENLILLNEAEVTEIPLSGEVAERKSEISGLSWYGDELILLPQYPDRFSDNGLGKIFYLKKNQIDNFLNDIDNTPLQSDYYLIDLSKFSDLFQPGSGFEAITTNNDTAYFSIESLNKGETESYVIFGIIDSIKKRIILDENSLTLVNSKIHIHNLSNETILSYRGEIIPIYEANGRLINPNSEVSIYNNSLKYLRKIDFPKVEYRITDVTSVDKSGKFWAINYFYPGDIKKLKVDSDYLIDEFGIGKSHFKGKPIERLVEFQFRANEIIIVKQSPIYLQLIENDSRNWEGIARYDGSINGFLLATDTFPKTILGFVKGK